MKSEGRVEFCQSDQWKTVCGNNWSSSEAQVVCKQLGYGHQGANIMPACNAVINSYVLMDMVCSTTVLFVVTCMHVVFLQQVQCL